MDSSKIYLQYTAKIYMKNNDSFAITFKHSEYHFLLINTNNKNIYNFYKLINL